MAGQMYVASYIMKTDCAIGLTNEERTEDLNTQMMQVGAVFLTHREVSAQEAAYRILPLPMKSMSGCVVFVDRRIDSALIQELDDSDPNVFCKSLLDTYEHRPFELQNVSSRVCSADYMMTSVRVMFSLLLVIVTVPSLVRSHSQMVLAK